MLFQSYFAEILSELEGISEDQLTVSPQDEELPPEVTVAGDATVSIKKLHYLSTAYECVKEAMLDRNASKKEFDTIEMKLGILDSILDAEIRCTFPNIPSNDVVDIWNGREVFHYTFLSSYSIECPDCALRIRVVIDDTPQDLDDSSGEEGISDLDQSVEEEIPVKKVVLN